MVSESVYQAVEILKDEIFQTGLFYIAPKGTAKCEYFYKLWERVT